ncbi:phage tail protein [Hymenobacter convexus]|uniref:phage tail protein n=1 Tax=Hymenobacter sp. CA1UV-4 TaxID=3063782 RepID=UPI00271307DE|nr:tail fiber protein [Hymenobacter sp. CA1UV-4]MDO7851421.1 tail fiber protein [Hymenobacter sp. CA1UV-4]
MDPFLGEIRIMPYGGGYLPRGWARCDGSLLPINQNTALFSLLGTFYGGNGQTTFALPDLRGRAAVGMGQGPGLSSYQIGDRVGTESQSLLQTELPAHTHSLGTVALPVSSANASVASPAGAVFAKEPDSNAFGSGTANGTMAAGVLNGTTNSVGGAQTHENRMPFLVLDYFIATAGVFPARQ